MQLYEQTMDAQEGVVYFLLEEMAQQRIKENLLAYALLLIRGALLNTNAQFLDNRICSPTRCSSSGVSRRTAQRL